MTDWLRQTGQRWKLNAGMAWIAAGVVALGAVIVAGVPSVAWILAALAFAAAGFCWTAFSVRCAACGKRAVFWAMLHEPGHGWLLRMTSTDRCPCCEDPGVAPAARSE
ncbi:MAG TPA: hypothetical protein VIZ58_05345 [Thermoanaerobaculia bacterium]